MNKILSSSNMGDPSSQTAYLS